ncbi:bone morphogenetic protein 1-like [Haliotis cracherodii]|uniref:bone morphogenetic protein 1-like n=1 Tax=Haliotis cracherodii TaxID=6455 RepID=UPI0039E9491D
MDRTWRHGLHFVLHGLLLCSTAVHSENTTTTPDGCGPLQLTAGSQPRTLTSPGYPSNIKKNLNCKWDVTARDGERVQVVVLDINILGISSCRTDYVKVYDGIAPNSPQLEDLCRFRLGSVTITSSGRYMRIELKTNFFVFGRGFKLIYTGVGFQVNRQGDLTAKGYIQSILSPGYPSFYEWTFGLTWRIYSGSLAKVIRMTVGRSHLPFNYKCAKDYLEAYDGFDTSSRSLAKWCGDERPSKDSSGSYMFIKFHASGTANRGIYKINYKQVSKPASGKSVNVHSIVIVTCSVFAIALMATYSVWKIRQRRNYRAPNTNRATVATAMSPNPIESVHFPHPEAVMPSTGTRGTIELPPYTSVDETLPPPSYESLGFGPNSEKY